MAYYIIDENGNRMRAGKDDRVFTEPTMAAVARTISYYNDVGYGNVFGVVNADTGEIVTWNRYCPECCNDYAGKEIPPPCECEPETDSPAASFSESWKQAIKGETHPIDTLFDDLD